MTSDECAALRPSVDQAAPLATVAVEGWSALSGENIGLMVARLDAAGIDPERPFEILLDTWPDAASLPVPVHPSEDPVGGPVSVTFGQILEIDGSPRWCDEAHPFTIAPLPPAPGSVAAQLAEVADLLDAALAPLDLTGTELAARSTDHVPAELALPYAAARLLHDEDGISRELDRLASADRDLVDRVVGQGRALTDTAGVTEARADILSTAGSVAPSTPIQLAAWSPTSGLGAHPSGDREPGEVQLIGGAAATGACTTVTFPEVTRLLGHQFSGQALASGAPRTFTEATMLLGGLPYVSRWALPTVLVAWVTKTAADYLAGHLPSELTDLLVDRAPDELWEDDLDGGFVEAVRLRFSSEGFDAGPAIAELALIVADPGITSRLKRRIKRATRTHAPTRFVDAAESAQLIGDVGASMEQQDADAQLVAELLSWIMTTFVGELIEQRGLASGHPLLGSEPGCWEAETRTPDLDPAVELTYAGAIEEGFVPEQYLAAELGTGRFEATIELPIGRHFLPPISSDLRSATRRFEPDPAEIEVQLIELVWTPERQRVEPGDVVTLNLQVYHAHDARVRLTDSLGTLDREMTPADGGVVFYTVPDDWDGEAIRVTAASLSQGGLRHPSHTAYRGELARSTWLVAGPEPAIFVEPFVRCLESGETVRFIATDEPLGTVPVEVRWAAERGTITADGRFTAPSSPGAARITATSITDPDVSTSFEVQIGGCEAVCAFDLTIDGLLGDEPTIRRSETFDPIGDRDTDDLRGPPGMGLAGVDWTSGDVTGIAAGTGIERTDEGWQLTGFPGPTYTVYGGSFAPNQIPVTDPWEDFLAGLDSGREIVGWSTGLGLRVHLDATLLEAPAVSNAWIDAPASPMLHLRGTATGPVLVGREITDVLDGSSYAMATRVEGEPIFGSLTLRFEGIFRPAFDHEADPDWQLPPWGEDLDHDGSPFLTRTYDLTSGSAWCGGRLHADHEEVLTPPRRGVPRGFPSDVMELPGLPETPAP